MPVITVDTSKLTRESKAILCEKMTDIICEISKAPREFVTVIVRENELDNFSINGELVSEILKKR
ncbi:tautomerase family protein [Clostridium sp.]|uniref:tautomerase family protein n=1 Tax=Clostridium sp. TaxID=1506 RepID=UPI00262482E3|nr:tautomerase family protein [Clostridium sp.]